MSELKRITAKEAREITVTSSFLLKNVYKWINDACKLNQSEVPLCKDCYDDIPFNNVVEQLRTDGYTVEDDPDNGCYMIRW